MIISTLKIFIMPEYTNTYTEGENEILQLNFT